MFDEIFWRFFCYATSCYWIIDWKFPLCCHRKAIFEPHQRFPIYWTISIVICDDAELWTNNCILVPAKSSLDLLLLVTVCVLGHFKFGFQFFCFVNFIGIRKRNPGNIRKWRSFFIDNGWYIIPISFISTYRVSTMIHNNHFWSVQISWDLCDLSVSYFEFYSNFLRKVYQFNLNGSDDSSLECHPVNFSFYDDLIGVASRHNHPIMPDAEVSSYIFCYFYGKVLAPEEGSKFRVRL